MLIRFAAAFLPFSNPPRLGRERTEARPAASALSILVVLSLIARTASGTTKNFRPECLTRPPGHEFPLKTQKQLRSPRRDRICFNLLFSNDLFLVIGSRAESTIRWRELRACTIALCDRGGDDGVITTRRPLWTPPNMIRLSRFNSVSACEKPQVAFGHHPYAGGGDWQNSGACRGLQGPGPRTAPAWSGRASAFVSGRVVSI